MAGGRINQLHQQLEGGGLAGPVRAEKAENLSLSDRQAQTIERDVWSRPPEAHLVVLREAFRLDGIHPIISSRIVIPDPQTPQEDRAEPRMAQSRAASK